jgi:uncharacterized protein YuzE
MYHLDEMTKVTYDSEADAMSITPEKEVLSLSKYVKSIDIDERSQVIIDIGDLDNIRSIEVLEPRCRFSTTKDVLRQPQTPEVKYDCYTNENGDANVLDVVLKGVGGLRAVWGTGTKDHLMFLTANGMPIATERRCVTHAKKKR